MDAGLLERMRKAAGRVFAGRGILAAYAFGSRIAGRPRPDSDLDIGYYLAGYAEGKTLSLNEELTMEARLCEELDMDVDLRNLGEATLEMRGRVLEDGVRIYSGDEVARVALESSTLSFYHDYKEIYEHMHEIRLRNQAR